MMSTGEAMSSVEGSGALALRENPYIGPRVFREDEQNRFFGRVEETAILEGLVLARQATLLFAQSGAGKSSLLRAGLIPSLRRERTAGYGPRRRTYRNMTVLRVLSVGGEIPNQVSSEKVRNVYVFSALLTLYPDEDVNRLAGLSLKEGLVDALAATHAREEEPDSTMPGNTLVIFDQFEELFTRHPKRWSDREDFFKQLRDALEEYPNLHVLFSMREDYIAELTPYTGLLPDQLRSQFRLEWLRKQAALDAITLPAQSAGRRFDKAAAELLVTRLRSGQANRSTTDAVPVLAPDLTEFVEPVQLQVVCFHLWANLPAEQTVIRTDDVERIADVASAMKKFYEQAVGEAVRQTRISEARLRTWFGQPPLITTAGTRGLVYRDSTQTGGLPNNVIDVLDKVYIIRAMVRGENTWYELAHDRMVDLVKDANAEWFKQNASQQERGRFAEILVGDGRGAESGRQGPLPPVPEHASSAEQWFRRSSLVLYRAFRAIADWAGNRVHDAAMWPANLLRDSPARLGRLARTFGRGARALLQAIPSEVDAWSSHGRDGFRIWLVHCVRGGARWTVDLVWQLTDLLGVPEVISFLWRAQTRSTPLTGPEIAAIASVLGSALRFEDIRVAEGGISEVICRRNGGRASVLFHTIVMPASGMHSRLNVGLLLYLAVQILQWELRGSAYLVDTIVAQREAGYDYGGPEGLRSALTQGRRYCDFNVLQQAQMVMDYYFLLQHEWDTSAYDPFIDDLRAGKI